MEPGGCADLASGQLRVWSASGEELAAVCTEELGDVLALKRQLTRVCQTPRFRQRLLHDGAVLDDATALPKAAFDLQLVLVPFSRAYRKHRDELIEAAATGQLLEVEKILQRPQDADLPGTQMGKRPLVEASSAGHVEVLELLLEARADSNLTGADGKTALQLAARSGHVETVRILLKAGALTDLSYRDTYMTALHEASSSGHSEVVRLLLDARADKDIKAVNDQSALQLASSRGHAETVRMLLAAGADTDSVSISGTALHIRRMLLQARADMSSLNSWRGSPPHGASAQGHVEVARTYAELGELLQKTPT
ncbi:mask [Symbiodinium sp. CCMP2456]|nr:mask [Symbiodinium sp. CCMP2456]